MPRKPSTRTAGRPAPPESLPTGTVTFLFTDIEGSTHLLQQAGPLYGSLLADHRRLLRTAFAAHRGREVDTQGDGFFVAFAAPARAIGAAADAQRALAAHPWPEPFRVRVRMGLHTGEAAVADGSYVGVAVHRAARIAAAAHGGQVLLSEATAALVRDELPDGTALQDLGEHRLKDFPRPARLHQLVLCDLPTVFPPPRTIGRNWRVPTPPGSFIGREDELAALATLLRDHRTRLVTVTGAGGIGKTRLALEAAHAGGADLPGGAVFVPLSAVTDRALVLGAIADAVGARREPGDDVHAAIAAALGQERTLLVLDNLEQVVDAAGDVADLAERVPAAVLLVTSRTLLRVRVEQQFPLKPLEEAAAAQLFTERAATVHPSGAERDEESAVEIARRLDGLPLAIELAAARVRMLPPRAILERLRDRLDVLGTGPVDLPQRQRTLRATMDWSHGLLAPHEQAVYARLGVFSGGWDFDAAESVCGRPGEPDLLDTMGALVDASLVVSDANGPEPRFTMLETVRADAAQRLQGSPDEAETERRHTDWVLGLAADLLHARGHHFRRAQQRLDRERANYRAAVHRVLAAGDLATAALLIRDAIGFLAFRDAEPEARAWLDQALARSAGAAPAVRGRLLVLRAVTAMVLGELSAIIPLLQQGAALLPQDRDYDFDRALVAVGGIQEGMEHGLPEAARAVELALDRFTALGMEIGQGTMHLAAGDLALATGDVVRASEHYESAVHLAESVGEDAMLGRALSLLGLSQLALGDVVAAHRSMLDGVVANRRAGLATSMAYSVEGLAALALAEDRPVVAARMLAAAAAARGRSARPLTPALPPLVEQLVSRSRELLGEDAFEQASEEGRRWSLHQALESGLEDLPTVPAQSASIPRTPSTTGPHSGPR